MNNELKSCAKDISEQYISMLSDWIPTDSSIAIAVNNSYIFIQPGHPSIHLEMGQQVLPGSIADQVLRTQKKQKQF